MTSPRPDFLRPQRGVPRLGWLALATCLAVLAVAAADAMQARQARDDALAHLTSVTAAAGPPPAAPAPARQELDRVLARPWGEMFVSIERAADPGVGWLSIDIAESGELHVVGLARGGGKAMVAAERLRVAGPWRDVVLTRLEPRDGGMQRFEIRAAAAAAPR